MEIQLSKKRKRTSELDWAAYRAIITRRYMNDRISMKALISEMEVEHGFVASKAQYEAQFDKWGLKKKLKREDWVFVKKKIEARQNQGKQSVVYFHTRPIPWKTVEKEVKRSVPISSRYLSTLPIETPADLFISSPGTTFLHGNRVDNLAFFQTRDFMWHKDPELFYSPEVASCSIWDCEDNSSFPLFDFGSYDPTSGTIGMFSMHSNLRLDPPSPFISNRLFTSRVSWLSTASCSQLKIDHPDFENAINPLYSNDIPYQDEFRYSLELAVYLISNEMLDYSQEQAAFAWLFSKETLQVMDFQKLTKLRSFEACMWAVLRSLLQYYSPKVLGILHEMDIDIGALLQSFPPAILCGPILPRGGYLETIIILHQLPSCSPFHLVGNDYNPPPTAEIEVLRILLEAGVPRDLIMPCDKIEPYRRDDPLHEAIECGDIESIRLLLTSGTDANYFPGLNTGSNKSYQSLPNDKTTPLVFAVITGNLEIVEMLLKGGAEVDAVSQVTSEEKHFYSRQVGRCYEIKQYATPLQAAAKLQNLGLVQLLLEWNANPNVAAIGPQGRIPLQIAIDKGDQEVITCLMNGGARLDLVEPGSPEKVRLLEAILDEDINRIRTFKGFTMNLQSPFEDGYNLLERAIKTQDSSLVAELIAIGVQVNYPCEGFNTITALGYAIDLLASTKSRTAEMSLMSVIRTLLDAGADPNMPCKVMGDWSCGFRGLSEDASPLCKVLSSDSHIHVELAYELSVMLLDKGAMVNIPLPYRIPYPETPLCMAVSRSLELMELLCSFEADVNYCFPEGKTALECAVCQEDFDYVDLLLDKGADVTSSPDVLQAAVEIDDIETALDMIDLLLESGADINGYSRETDEGPIRFKRGPASRTALQVAASCNVGRIEIVKRLIEAGADINAPASESEGLTALQGAAMTGHMNFVLLFLEKGANVNAPGARLDGRTALEGAAEWGRLDIVQLLINAGADTHLPGRKRYRSAARCAWNVKSMAIYNLLESYFEGDGSDEEDKEDGVDSNEDCE